MTIEQKAKAYDEALTKSKEFLTLCEKCGAKDTIDFLKGIFSELKESEDEKIRKALIDLFSSVGKKDWRDIPTEKIIAWLEKQGEQKPAWSKEDEDYYDAILAKLEVTQDDAGLTDNQMEFLKSLKDKMK